MSSTLYVVTDEQGRERLSGNQVTWVLPPVDEDGPAPITRGTLVLRQPIALMDVLDHSIFTAQADGDATEHADGTVTTQAAHLVRRTPWDVERAARWAIDCAEHELAFAVKSTLPDGTNLVQSIATAREVLDLFDGDAVDHVGYLAKLSAYRRLRHELSELQGFDLGQVWADEDRNVEALDDPVYASVIPVTDSVLAAMEGLRHHLLPRRAFERREGEEESEQHDIVEHAITAPAIWETPWGPTAKEPKVLRYEPAWAAAREAARHARLSARLRLGTSGERDERNWQADRLENYLEIAPAH